MGLHHHHGGQGLLQPRQKLLQQRIGQAAKLFVQLQLHPRGQKGRTFQQPRNARVDIVLQQAAQTFGNAGIFGGKFRRALIQQREFIIIGVAKGLFHAPPRSGRIRILPAPRSISAVKPTGISAG